MADQSVSVSISLNDTVKLKPTLKGWSQIIKSVDEFNDHLRVNYPKVIFRMNLPKKDSEGFIEGPLYDLLHYFDNRLLMPGLQFPFTELQIIKDDDDDDEPSPRMKSAAKIYTLTMELAEAQRKLEELGMLLNDDLYKSSKDWRGAKDNLAERVLWLISSYESKCEECETYLNMLGDKDTK